ncbi:MAG: hypothetical protein HY709_05605, partial [Candidatus Latescibacteria bacterium]|nr:hypothetical protein [Candidatus Latescibacterota bacterium]
MGGDTIGDIVWSGSDLWVGTDTGISRWVGYDWVTYGVDQGLGRGSIGAIATEGETIWVSTIFDTTISGQGDFQAGDGLSVSFDRGSTWRHITNEPIFGGLPGGPRTGLNNGAFGLALDDGTIWGAFFAGSLVRSNDEGVTWERILPDGSESIDYNTESVRGLRQRTFSVLAYHDTVWVGTAAGIGRTTDGGTTWEHFTAEENTDGSHKKGTISGNWVVTLARQRFGDQMIIWAGTKPTGRVSGESEDISFSRDDGRTWEVASLGMSAWNFGFYGPTVLATTDKG